MAITEAGIQDSTVDNMNLQQIANYIFQS